LCALEGATGLRRLIFSETRVESIYSFENWGKRFFQIHASFKFLTLVFTKHHSPNQSFPAVFMLRDEGFLKLPESQQAARSVFISSNFIHLTSPEHSSVVELRDDRERRLVERIYREVPALAAKDTRDGAWEVKIHRELDMTDDAWQFHKADWLMERVCIKRASMFVAPPADWYQARTEQYVEGLRYVVPEGTKYRVTMTRPPSDRKNGKRWGQNVRSISGFLLRSHAQDEHEMPIETGGRYLPLYEGRLLHQFDHSAKAYVTGEGRGAKWQDLDMKSKAIVPHFFVEALAYPTQIRAGFCNVTGQTNERSLLSALVPGGCPAGNTIGIVQADREDTNIYLVWIAVANSFAPEFLIRQKITTHISFFYLETLPFVRPLMGSHEAQELANRAGRLVSITPEIQLADPAIDLHLRARLRSEIDAIVAGLYDLSPVEFAYILTTFPLLDRDQPPLRDDFFVRWNRQGRPKLEPRSYVTRDTALLAYFRHRGIAPPEDLALWYRDEVAVNMIDDESCPFRMGPIRNLEQRVAEAHRRGAIAYIPSKAKKWDPIGPYQPRAGSTV